MLRVFVAEILRSEEDEELLEEIGVMLKTVLVWLNVEHSGLTHDLSGFICW